MREQFSSGTINTKQTKTPKTKKQKRNKQINKLCPFNNISCSKVMGRSSSNNICFHNITRRLQRNIDNKMFTCLLCFEYIGLKCFDRTKKRSSSLLISTKLCGYFHILLQRFTASIYSTGKLRVLI